MKIGVLGSGTVGQVLAAGFLKHGHAVMLGTRDPQKPEAQKWLKENAGGRVGTFRETAAFAELAVLATLGRVAENAIELAGPENLAGKTLIDATNPLADAPPIDGVLPFTTGPNESLGEKVQAKAPESRVVKAFNSVGSARMINPHYAQGTPTMFLCGDSAEAKAQVSEIIRQFGWEPFDCGGIRAARALEPLCMLWCIPGFLRGQWTHAFKVLTH
ncbi:MAG TPA: NAD(P)-binding domain-containing protein [Bryobacteraceae bacterium]|nr:NAD(P)-binding domain-containing protein [Bryobacteraceae bacterium]HUK16238.1 NAD(P)-binding domain-containing protein [Bryobacteraceae bacterium]